MNQTTMIETTAATLTGETATSLARIHDTYDNDLKLFTAATTILDQLPPRQTATLIQTFHTIHRYTGMDPFEAATASRIIRNACRLAATKNGPTLP